MSVTDDVLGIQIVQGIQSDGNYHILLTDYKKWKSLEIELDKWLKENNGKRQGLLITYKDVGFDILFKLRWS